MLKLLKRLSGTELLLVLGCIAFIVSQVYLDLTMPDYMSKITRLVQTPGSNMRDIWIAGGWMLLFAFGSLICALVTSFLAVRTATSFSARLRGMVFDKTLDFSMEEMNRFSTSSLITRTTNDITQVQTVIAMGLQLIIKGPILAVWAIIKIMGKSWQWTTATGFAVLILVAILFTIIIFAVPKFKVTQKQTDDLNRITRENLTGLRVVRSFNAEEYEEKKFAQANNNLTKTNLFTNRMMALMQPGMMFIMSGLSMAIYWIGAYLLNAADMTAKMGLFGDMVVFSSYALLVVQAFMLMTMMFILLPRAAVSAGRINEVMQTIPHIIDGNSSAQTDLQGEIEFRNVSFQYPDASGDTLSGISFSVHKGETVAIIGATGSGKSTLVNLIPRFYDVSGGEVLIDGVNVKNYKQEALREKIGYVPQKAVLFSGTVSSNVAYGAKDKSADNIAEAVAVAQGEEFARKMEGEYDAPISQGGTNISGGQKQRLSIARAVCRKPEIYVFDDSFSALDYKTDRNLRQALKQEIADVTCLIVAQRIGTIKDADKIIVLEEGKIVGMDTHVELLKSCEVYKEIAYSQLSEEELRYA